jgi:hypothetical protein
MAQSDILGGDNLTVAELARLTLDILGEKKSIVTLPNGLLDALAWLGLNLRLPLPFNPNVDPYATLYWFMDNAKAKRELGVDFRPARAVLEPTLAWVQERFLAKPAIVPDGEIAREGDALIYRPDSDGAIRIGEFVVVQDQNP